MKEWFIGSFTFTVVALALIGFTFTSCSNSKQAHYNLATQCIDSGGSWIDTSTGNSYKGLCINTNKGTK